MEHCTPITQCLACGGTDLIPTLDLKDQPLANNFQEHAGVKEDDLWFPLAVNRCQDCDHLQLTHAVDPKLIYTHYLYVSGTSGTYVEYMDWYAKFVCEQFADAPITVLDIGCNDGSQLNAFKKLGLQTYGVDPAENLHAKSSANHNVTLGFWDEATSLKLDTQLFDVITTQNSFAHIPDPLTYLQLARERLTDNGKIFISTSQADMVLNGEFDTIYHEHISYYNAESMQALANRAGLHLIDVIKTPIHGTSYVFVLSEKPSNTQRVENILAMESKLHMGSTYRKWANDVQTLLVDLKEQIDLYREWGYTIVGYGAAAKGMTLINASDITLHCVIDDNPLKQGLYCPGTSIPVVDIDWLAQVNNPERVVFVPLAWNFYDEIKKKIKAKRNNTEDIFLRYFPSITSETDPQNQFLK
jgi:2-polyprenyl-3-methyl-5-hydroxy-6-metoxy-1,4-benzoquinol methylase